MMPELGKYAGAVLSAYGVSLALIGGVTALSLWRAVRVARALSAIKGNPDA